MWGMIAGAVISTAGNIYSSHEASKAGKKSDPFGKYRGYYGKTLKGLTQDPASFYSNPLYQAAFGQGQQAVMRGMAGKGYLGSGNMAVGLQNYGQSFGWEQFKDWTQLLAHWAGADIGGQQVQAAQNAGNFLDQAMGQLGGLAGMMGLGSGGTVSPISSGQASGAFSQIPSFNSGITYPNMGSGTGNFVGPR